jgi:hypothetical protein
MPRAADLFVGARALLGRIPTTLCRTLRRTTITAALALTLSCASSSSQQRLQQAYERPWAVTVTSHPDDVKSCARVASFTISSLPCTNILHDVYMGGTECARFWTVDQGGDTLLVKGGKAGETYEKVNAGDAYVCSAPLLPPEAEE